jgi:hypothetical protein
VLSFLTHKAFGKTRREEDDRPTYARSNHIKNIKMKISHYMPSGAAWVDLADGSGHGNPTKHKAINNLIADIVQFEVRGEGSESKDVRDMTMAEVDKELEPFRQSRDELCRYRNTLMGLYQYQFITRMDDIVNFKVDDPKGHPEYEMAIAQSVKWSKNVRDNRNCPDQLLLAASDHKHCLHLALALWLETYLNQHPNATYMMSPGVPEGKTVKAHKKFTKAISKTYRNQWEREVLKKREFKDIYKGNDKRPVGLHSKRKTGASQAKKRGAGADQVNHRGRWVVKKGSRIVNAVYIDPEDKYADALCASLLAIGGPIRYKLKRGIPTDKITTRWLADNMVPNIAKRFPDDHLLIQNLGLAILWLAHDGEAAEDLAMPDIIRNRAKEAYTNLAINNKPSQPVEKINLHVYRHDEETIIEEIFREEVPTDSEEQAPPQQQQQQGLQQQETRRPRSARPQNVADELARLPSSGGSAATQHVLQTLVVQVQNLQQEQRDLKQAMLTIDQRSRGWMEN